LVEPQIGAGDKTQNSSGSGFLSTILEILYLYCIIMSALYSILNNKKNHRLNLSSPAFEMGRMKHVVKVPCPPAERLYSRVG
jgi:hypothetical protein